MRTKILLALALGIVIVVWRVAVSEKQALAPEKKEISADSLENFSTNSSVSFQTPSRDGSVAASNAVEPRASATTNSIDERIIKLTELGGRNDAASLQKILASLNDSDPEIREAALDATIQFGSRDAIPLLKKIAEKTEDASEKVEILEAAKYLELPTLSEVRAQRRTNLNLNPVRRPEN